MLKQLRNKKTAKKVWILLAVIIVPAFTLWGIGGALRSKNDPASSLELQDAIDAIRIQAILQFGENYEQIKKYLNFQEQARERLILLGEAKKRRIGVDNKEVIELIESYPFFQRNGRFDNKIYNDMLKYSLRTQPRIFEEQTRQNLMLSKLYKQVTDNVLVSEEETGEEYRKANEEISIFYIVSSPAEFLKTLSPAQAELKAYFSKNSIKFKQPLSFNIEYVTLNSQEKITEAIAKLNNSDFNKFAKDMGLTLKETGLFSQADPIPGIGWSPEVSNLISGLKIGQFSPPIQTDSNVYLLKLKDKKEAFIPDFESIKDKVRDSFLKEKSGELALAKIEEALKKLKQTNDFKRAAKETGLKSDSTALFKSGSYIEGIGASDSFWNAARNLKENEFSGIINMPSGFFIIKLKTRMPFDAKKFETERVDFKHKLLQQKKQEYFSKFVEGLKIRAR